MTEERRLFLLYIYIFCGSLTPQARLKEEEEEEKISQGEPMQLFLFVNEPYLGT